MTILYNGGRTAVKAFFCSYILKGGKYMKFNRLNGVSSPLLTIKPIFGRFGIDLGASALDT
ncbi:MAG: hypothetical protein FWH35_10380 [Treponema sp.]|nr:hypothetical protein [Treponema sp.]